MDKMKKALTVIEGSLIADEPEDKRLSFIYRMAHVGNGECEHKEWERELDTVYAQLLADNIISPIEPKPSSRLLTDKLLRQYTEKLLRRKNYMGEELREILEDFYAKTASIKDAEIEALIIEIFAKLCNPKEDEVQAFDWALSKGALEWVHKMQSDAECKRVVWSIIEALKAAHLKGGEG